MIRFKGITGSQPGFLLVEVLLGIALFALFSAAIGFTLLYGQESTIQAGDRIRATQYAHRSIEAARAIRDASFSSVTTGTKGVWVDKTSEKWAFTGSYVTSTGGFISTVTVSSLASDWIRLTAETKWKRGYARSGSVILMSEITDWRSTKTIGNWSSPTVDGSYTDGGTPLFNNIATYSGSYAFVSAGAGMGLYLFNISNTASPSRISSSFSLGTSAYDVAVVGKMLIVATADSNQEIRVYSLASPSAFSSSNLLGTYNLPGSARARSLAASGDMFYVGASTDATGGQDEFYAFSVTQTGAITLKDSINDDSNGISAIALSGTAAYLAGTLDSSELRVVDVESGSNIVLLGGYNLSDRTVDGTAIAVSGTSALIGTQKLTSLEEIVLFDLEAGGVPVPPPGPWYHEGSGSVVGLDMDPTRCYGFVAAQSNRKAFQVFNVRNKSTLAEVATYTSTTGIGRGLLYDLTKDRVYVLTDQSLLIFKPAAATGTCP